MVCDSSVTAHLPEETPLLPAGLTIGPRASPPSSVWRTLVTAVTVGKHGGCISCRFRLDYTLLADGYPDSCRVVIDCARLGRTNDRLHCLEYEEGCGSPN